MPGEEKLGEAVLYLSTQAADLVKGIGQAKVRADALQDHLTGVADTIKGALGGIGIAFSLHALIEETAAAEDAEAALASAVQSTGAAAGFTAEQLRLQAGAMQDLTRYSDEAIMGMQASLLAFQNVQGAVFLRAEKAVLDFAAATKREPVDAARTLGLALNDPAEGVAKLTRAGVSLNAGLRETIKVMAENGQVIQAQNMLLDALAQSYGGRAAAAANTLGGALDQLKNKFSDTFLEVRGPVRDSFVQFIKLVTENLPKIAAVANAAFAGFKVVVENIVLDLFKLGQSFRKAMTLDFKTDYLADFWEESKSPIEAAKKAYEDTGKALGELKVQQDAALASTAALGAGLDLASQKGLAAAEAAQQAAIKSSQAVGQALTGPLIEAGMTYDQLLFKAQESSARAQQAAALADTTARAGIASSAEAAKRLAEQYSAEAQKFAQAAQSNLAQLNANMLAAKQATAATIGGMVAAWAQGTINFRQFVTQMILEIGKLIAKLLILKAVSSFLSSVGGSFLSGIVGGIRARAEGGPVSAGSPYLVGERGPELFVPDRSGTIIPNGAGGGGVNLVQNFNVTGLDMGSAEAARRFLATAAAQMRSGAQDALAFARASADQTEMSPRRAYA